MRTIGKNRGIARLADADGHFRMVALDQRPPLFDAIAQAKGITRDQVEYADVTAAKRLLVEGLSPHCSSMLFDPNFAVPAAIDLLPARCGLIMTLEEHRVEETSGGRKSRAIANWSVEKIRAIGGDAVKVLAWYRPDADSGVNEHQKRFVREIGEECAHHDIPYVLELLVYPFLGSANHTADYVESPGKLPGLVIDSVREFDAIGAICRERNIPWVLLSGGAAPEKFERVLEFAYAAGAGGFLAGRTIWLDAVRKHFPDRAAVAASLRKDGVAVLESLNALTKAKGSRWKARFPAFAEIKQEGDFARAY